MAETIRIEGDVHTWGVGDHSRRFLQGVLPFADADRAFRAELYNAVEGKGEQRPEIVAHVRKLTKDVAGGEFTPTPVAVGVRKKQAKLVKYEFGRAYLEVSPADPLPLTDGQQRFGALRALADVARKAGQAELLRQIAALPIQYTLHIDGDTKADFIRLQAGRPVEAAHLQSMKVQQGLVAGKDAEAMTLAYQVARELHTVVASPFYKFVKFDARGTALPLPVTTLCARGASDLGVSLVGLAKVGAAMGVTDPKVLAGYVVAVWKALQRAPGLVGQGMPLCPPPEGNKGGATMIIGLAVCLAYRLKNDGRTQPDADDLDRLQEVALEELLLPVAGSFSAADKRRLLKEFAASYLGGCTGERHQGLVAELQRILTPSSFGNQAFPKPAKAAAVAAAPAGTIRGGEDAAEEAEEETAGELVGVE
jgi:hypothetical protein